MKGVAMTGKQRRHAWKLLRKGDLERALAYVADFGKAIDLGEPVPYKIWGREGIDKNSIEQMEAGSSIADCCTGRAHARCPSRLWACRLAVCWQTD